MSLLQHSLNEPSKCTKQFKLTSVTITSPTSFHFVITPKNGNIKNKHV